MSVRKIERTRTFADNLENLSKKYAGLSGAVDAALNQYAATGESATSFRLIRVKGLPVFKDRLAFGNRGKCGADRLLLRPGTGVGALPVREVEARGCADKGDSGRLEIGRSPRKWRIAASSG